MKKFSRVLLKILSVLYKITPFFLGVLCYYPFYVSEESAYPLFDAAWAAVRLYCAESEEGMASTLLLEIARFMALTTTLSILITILNKFIDIVGRVKLIFPGSTVVCGSSEYAEHLFQSLSPRQRIRGRDKLIKGASRYLLMFSDDTENLEFYSRNYDYLKDKRVYIMLDNISRQNIENPLITVFSIAENCARKYWRDYPAEKSEKIALISFDNVGQNILLYGLQVNLIDPGQHFEYHIYGDGAQFRREHTELDKMAPDEIIFHDDGSFETAEIAAFDRIIICGDADENRNIEILSRLLAAVPIKGRIYVYAPNGDIITNLFGSDGITCFGTADEIASIDVILNERSMEAARAQHEYYVQQHGGTPWEKLNAFNRYSNVSSSDYLPVVKRLIKNGVPFEKLAELEHIRWCRYHYINNWKYAPETDKSRRLHNCLIPFSELREEEKLKDVEAIKSKLPNDDQERGHNNGIE
ncbi:MAG: hypothetical protein J1F04_10150 [Oscillospiraceae bacterium]|nr:hypothetical protein [Oscillospiraceae bacterium]